MKSVLIALFALIALSIRSFAQDAGEDPAHEQLRSARAAIIEAIESRDLDRMLKHVHPDVVVTWQDATVCHGLDGLRAFYDEMGKDAFVAFKVPHKPDRVRCN